MIEDKDRMHKEDLIDITTGAMATVLTNNFLEICMDKLAEITAYCVMNQEDTDEPYLKHILSIILPESNSEVRQ